MISLLIFLVLAVYKPFSYVKPFTVTKKSARYLLLVVQTALRPTGGK